MDTSINGSSSSKKRKREAKEEESYTLLRRSGRVADWDSAFKELYCVQWVASVDSFSRVSIFRWIVKTLREMTPKFCFAGPFGKSMEESYGV